MLLNLPARAEARKYIDARGLQQRVRIRATAGPRHPLASHAHGLMPLSALRASLTSSKASDTSMTETRAVPHRTSGCRTPSRVASNPLRAAVDHWRARVGMRSERRRPRSRPVRRTTLTRSPRSLSQSGSSQVRHSPCAPKWALLEPNCISPLLDQRPLSHISFDESHSSLGLGGGLVRSACV